jgi:transposase
VTEVLPGAEAVFDKFHVLQHASAALDARPLDEENA